MFDKDHIYYFIKNLIGPDLFKHENNITIKKINCTMKLLIRFNLPKLKTALLNTSKNQENIIEVFFIPWLLTCFSRILVIIFRFV